MSNSLRLGISGLGTVGAALIRMLEEKQDMLSERCGRSVRVTGVNARSKGKDRGASLEGMKWFDDPVALAQSADIDVYVELMGGEDDPAYSAVKAALNAGQACGYRQQGIIGQARG